LKESPDMTAFQWASSQLRREYYALKNLPEAWDLVNDWFSER